MWEFISKRQRGREGERETETEHARASWVNYRTEGWELQEHPWAEKGAPPWRVCPPPPWRPEQRAGHLGAGHMSLPWLLSPACHKFHSSTSCHSQTLPLLHTCSRGHLPTQTRFWQLPLGLRSLPEIKITLTVSLTALYKHMANSCIPGEYIFSKTPAYMKNIFFSD